MVLFYFLLHICLGMAWMIIPRPWSFETSSFKYNSWRAFVAAAGIPSLLSAIFLMFFPESPKFLMSQNRMQEALTVFRKIFEINSGTSGSIYPVSFSRIQGNSYCFFFFFSIRIHLRLLLIFKGNHMQII